MRVLRVVLILLFAASPSLVLSQDALLVDNNGDGTVAILSFGDSITYGVGDGIAPGEFITGFATTPVPGGYPSRLERDLHIPVVNAGEPGEVFTTTGVNRLPGLVLGSPADIVTVFEGANDGFSFVTSEVFRNKLQRAINSVRAIGRTLVLVTIPVPCCGHVGTSGFVDSFNSQILYLAGINGVPVADTARAWRSTCVNKGQCELFNLPEGLHPNTKGYDVISQVLLGTLYGINIFSPTGAAELEAAAALAPGTIIVRPDETASEEEEGDSSENN